MIKKITPKVSDSMLDCCGSSSKKPEPQYPRFRIELQYLPEAKKWDLESEYTITLKLKMVGISMARFQKDAEFDIVGIDPKATAEESKDKE